MKRGWTDDPICKLCTNDQETPTHLCKDCPFTKEVWELIKIWFSLTDLSSISTTGSLHNYWRRCRRKVDKNQRRRIDGIIIYFWWNIWKERNRRTFQQKSLSPRQVASLCKDDISQFSLATSPIHNTANQQWTSSSVGPGFLFSECPQSQSFYLFSSVQLFFLPFYQFSVLFSRGRWV